MVGDISSTVPFSMNTVHFRLVREIGIGVEFDRTGGPSGLRLRVPIAKARR